MPKVTQPGIKPVSSKIPPLSSLSGNIFEDNHLEFENENIRGGDSLFYSASEQRTPVCCRRPEQGGLSSQPEGKQGKACCSERRVENTPGQELGVGYF